MTPDRSDSVRLLDDVAAAVAGGCRIVQYRNKQADQALQRQQAALLANFCKSAGVCFIINDDLALALELDADGLHLGGRDGDLVAARRQLGPDRVLGASCYNDPSRMRDAVAAGADYVALGAMFPTRIKPDAAQASLELLRDVKADCPVPVATIGGITLDNAPMLLDAGADMVAVISDLFEAPDIAARAQKFQQLFNH